MAHNLRIWFALLIVSAAAIVSTLWQRHPAASVLAANADVRWYRGNLHTHTLWSDGDDYPEMVAAWYRDRGYAFLAFTDHNVLPASERWSDVKNNKGKELAYEKLKARFPDWVDERFRNDRLEVRLRTFPEVEARLSLPGQFLLLQGEEISDTFNRLPVHLNVTNVREVLPPLGGDSVTEVIERNVQAVQAQRERTGQPMLVHLNHPNFVFGVTAEDLLPVRGEQFFEVYNGHPAVGNDGTLTHASTERIWDILLTRRLAELKLPILYGLATDDGHSYHQMPSRASEPGRGWLMVLAPELTPAAIIEALESGRFYASSGVFLDRVISDETGLDVEVRAEAGLEYTIEFIGTRRGYNPVSEPMLDQYGKPMRATRRYSADIGEKFAQSAGTRASYRFQGDEIYVRAKITSSRKHPNPSVPGEFERAWVQPTPGPAAPAPAP